jgi:lipoprotein-releasing system ATP-binding protein
MSEIVVACRDLKKTYQGPEPVPVLHGVSLEVRSRERVAIMGRSGSGKSTLLHLLGGLDTPTSGSVSVQGRAIAVWLRYSLYGGRALCRDCGAGR